MNVFREAQKAQTKIRRINREFSDAHRRLFVRQREKITEATRGLDPGVIAALRSQGWEVSEDGSFVNEPCSPPAPQTPIEAVGVVGVAPQE